MLHVTLGGEAGLWAAVLVMFLAIFAIGGFLLAYLVRVGKSQNSSWDL